MVGTVFGTEKSLAIGLSVILLAECYILSHLDDFKYKVRHCLLLLFCFLLVVLIDRQYSLEDKLDLACEEHMGACLLRGHIALSKGDVHTAQAIARYVSELDIEDEGIIRLEAMISCWSDDQSLMEHWIESHPEDTAATEFYARHLHAQKHYQRAIHYYQLLYQQCYNTQKKHQLLALIQELKGY
ncbi:hypothetical protein OAT84_01020 [Gammaproteobacteria bacterium]|nr:hypothetical protein [Gammaproteobacteria bacterium]